MARKGEIKAAIRKEIAGLFGYDFGRTLATIRPGCHFDVPCQGSVPESILAFLESTCYEDAIKNDI